MPRRCAHHADATSWRPAASLSRKASASEPRSAGRSMSLPPVPEAPAKASLVITAEAPRGAEIAELIDERLAHSYAHSPAESVHALSLGELDQPNITFWTARLDGALVARHFCAIRMARANSRVCSSVRWREAS